MGDGEKGGKPRYIEALAEFTLLTDQLAQAVEAADWEQAAAVVADREAVMQRIDCMSPSERAIAAADREPVAAQIRSLLQLDQTLISQVRDGQLANRQEIALHDLVQTTVSAYRRSTQVRSLPPLARFVDKLR